MRQHFEEVGRYRLELDFQGMIINRLDSEIGRNLAILFGSDVFCVYDRCQQIGVFGGRFRIDKTLPREHEIGSGDGRAIGPFAIGAQLECVCLAIGGRRIAFGSTRNNRGLGILCHQSCKQVTENVSLIGG